MDKKEQSITYLKIIITPLCRFPADIQVTHTIDERGLLLDLNANDRDLSRIIGKNGINAWSLRNLLRLWGQNNDAVVKLLIKGKGLDFYKPFEKKIYEYNSNANASA